MLRFEPDTSHADWVIHAPVTWQELVTCGPRGHEAEVRVLPLPEDDISERGLYSRMIPYLRAATTTPEDCLHALWLGATGIACGAEPGLPLSVLEGPTVALTDETGHPVRRYRLFRGPVDDVGRWGAVDPASGTSTDRGLPPAHLLWPADRAWFVASDVDDDDTCVSGPGSLVRALRADPVLTAGSSLGCGRRR